MYWLIIGDALGVCVLLPLLFWSLLGLESSLRRLDVIIENIVQEVRLLPPTLDAVPRLAETQVLTGAGAMGIVRYSEELAPLLSAGTSGGAQ